MTTHGSVTMELVYPLQAQPGEEDHATIKVRVAYVYYPFCPGACECRGLQIEPDTPAEIEITSVTAMNGVELELSESQREVVELCCFEDVKDTAEYAKERQYEDKQDLL